MAILDEIAKEKQRIGETLARVDGQREKLVSQLGELEATERMRRRFPAASYPLPGQGSDRRGLASCDLCQLVSPLRRAGACPIVLEQAFS